MKFLRQLFFGNSELQDVESDGLKWEMVRYIAANITRADVVITEKQYAVALEYEAENMDAPQIVARGKDDIIPIILGLCKEENIAIVKHRFLARALYEIGVGNTVPVMYWEPIVTILAKVYRHNEKYGKVEKRKNKHNQNTEVIPKIALPDPITLEIGECLVPLTDTEKGAPLTDQVYQIREEIAQDFGLVIPLVKITGNKQLGPTEYCIAINGIVMDRGKLNGNSPFGINAGDRIVTDYPSVIRSHVTELIKKHMLSFLNRQVIKNMLEAAEKDNSAVVIEVEEKLCLATIQRVFKNLLREQVSIRNVPAILEALADFGATTKDEQFLTEKSRQALARQICLQYTDKERVLQVLTIEPALEEWIIAGKTETSSGTTVALEPSVQKAWIEALTRPVAEVKERGLRPVILCSEAARFLVKASTEREFPELAVLSVPEIVPDVSVEAVGEISLPDLPDVTIKDTGSWEELMAMTGLEEVKQKLLEIRRFAARRGKNNLPSLHMVFRGNPGTGKSTVARLIGKIFAHDGIITSSDTFIETDREGLIGRYVGQTAPKTAERVNEALGGVLFIDEAYSLLGTTNDFGPECLATLVKRMEDHRKDFVCIMAGYTKEMNAMLKTNPGLRDRIQFYIDFPDYSAEELVIIFKNFCAENHLVLDKTAEEALLPWFSKITAAKDEQFANARIARKIFERVQIQQALRGKDDCITLDDIERAGTSSDVAGLLEKKKGVGF
jgi:type III secretion system FlhB-like substrate exporter/SpoVK/Ycf46/Vps4 family AAA+-type ATPase